jgi:hypothetical protein
MKPLLLLRDRTANAAVEMALVAPLLLALMFGAVELGNYFMTEHALEKQVRDGARYAARLSLSDSYSCPDTVFADANATSDIVNVTETGAVSGTGFPRFSSGYWARTCGNDTQAITVSVRCVSKNDIDTGGSGNSGIYASLNGDIPVVKVSARVKYLSVLSQLGFSAATNICLQAESESAVQGI